MKSTLAPLYLLWWPWPIIKVTGSLEEKISILSVNHTSIKKKYKNNNNFFVGEHFTVGLLFKNNMHQSITINLSLTLSDFFA